MLPPCPFGIAKVLDCTASGDLTMQWLANAGENVHGTFKPGWTTPKTFAPYFAAERKAASHVPYTSEAEGFQMNQRDILMHGFELTETCHLPAPLIRAIARHPHIWWEPAGTVADAQEASPATTAATVEAAAAAAAGAAAAAIAAAPAGPDNE